MTKSHLQNPLPAKLAPGLPSLSPVGLSTLLGHIFSLKKQTLKSLGRHCQALAGNKRKEKSLGLITEQLAPEVVDSQGKVFI